jgi:hypothetical protein
LVATGRHLLLRLLVLRSFLHHFRHAEAILV